MSNWSFMSHLTNYLNRPRLGDQKAPTLWPSEASAVIENEYGELKNIGRCRRSVFFRFLVQCYKYYDKYSFYEELVKEIKTKEIPPETYLQFIWKQGQLYEDFLLESAKNSGVYIDDQTQVYIPEFNVSGKIDIIVLDPSESKYRILEAKSVYGFNANKVLGTPSERKQGQMGVPKPNYLMQLGIYQWWYANNDDNFSDALLVAGARDTGKYAEFGLTVERNEETNEDHIYYYQNDPYPADKVDSKITIQNIMSQYKYIQDCLDTSVIPERDFDLKYSDEQIDTLYSRGKLNKSETARYEKRKSQIENKSSRINKQIDKGDWQCGFCSYRKVCYKENNQPRDVSI